MRSGWKITALFMTMLLAVSACAGPAGTAVTTEDIAKKEQEAKQPKETGISKGSEDPDHGRAEEKAAESLGARETDYDKENPPKNSESQGRGEVRKASEEKQLTLEKILEMSGKEDAGWADFQDYASQDIGSGLMIWRYEVDQDFAFLIGGAGVDKPPMYMYLVSQADQESQPVDIRTGDVEGYIREHRTPVSYTGIKGHIKEVHEDYVLISSDTDDFPGVFRVSGVHELAEPGELKGGTSVFVLMEDLREKDDSGVPGYKAAQCYPLSEERAEADLLLTDAPEFALTDVLSSSYSRFTVSPGNYSWDVEENGIGNGIVACGANPLDEARMKAAAKLKLPRYNRLDSVGYTFSTEIMPDRLTVRCWPARDIGESKAQAERITTYYYMPFILELEPGKVYEFDAEWRKENMGRRGFSGSASYVVVTE